MTTHGKEFKMHFLMWQPTETKKNFGCFLTQYILKKNIQSFKLK